MGEMHNLARGFWLVLALFALACGPASAAESKIGVAAAVKNEVAGVFGGSVRPLAVGSDVFANERVRTGEASAAQLLFIDKTSISIGPKAELMLDRFVYDPNAGTGQVVLNTVRGAFRFVTGSQNPKNYTISTPVGTIGIRGTIIDILALSDRVIILLVKGSGIITTFQRNELHLTQPGTAYTLWKNGRYEGPYPWDGTIVNAIGDISFPLYGWYFQGDPQNGFAGNPVNFNNIDQLNGIINRSTGSIDFSIDRAVGPNRLK